MYYQGAVDVLASRLGTTVLAHPLRVAITGIDAAGKTTLADELRDDLIRFGRPVVSISIDDYECPRAERYRRGVESAPGYYHDSFDFRAPRDRVLVPLGPGAHFSTDGACSTSPMTSPWTSLTTLRRGTPQP